MEILFLWGGLFEEVIECVLFICGFFFILCCEFFFIGLSWLNEYLLKEFLYMVILKLRDIFMFDLVIVEIIFIIYFLLCVFEWGLINLFLFFIVFFKKKFCIIILYD